MINFNQVDAPVKLSVDFILSKLDEVQIFYFYFGHFELNKSYHSKFRKDRTPSTGFYLGKNGRIIYNDLKTGEKLNCFAYVAKLFNCSYGEAIKRIAGDFGLSNNEASPAAKRILSQSIEFDKETKKQTIIQIIPSSWNANHLSYWKQYDVDISDLKQNNVYPVKRLFINKMEYKVDELCFAYVVKEKVSKEVKEYLKIYQPYSQNMKWISNVPLTVPFGLYELKYGTDHLVIGKAQKDRLVLLKFFESVIGTQNESTSSIPDRLVKHFTFNFPRRTIIWDADETGVVACTKFNPKGFGYFNTPKELLAQDIKDVSDYVKAFGLKALEKLFKIKGIL